MNWSNRGLYELPEISEQIEVESLNVSKNKLSKLPSSLTNYKNLKKLVLHSNKFNHFPPVIFELTSLQQLTLQNNRLKSVPKEISKLVNLVRLSLSDNQITEIPPEIGDLPKLEELFLRNNPLKQIPFEIGNLKNLIWLDLCNCSLIAIPSSLGDLPKLKILNLSNNNLEFLPEQLCQCNSLKVLDIEGNNLSLIPPDTKKEGCKSIKNYLHSQLALQLQRSKMIKKEQPILCEEENGIQIFDYFKDFGTFENIGKRGGGSDGVSKTFLKSRNEYVAIKILGPSNKTLYKNEIKIMKKLLDSPYLVKLLGISKIPGGIADIIVMEYYERDLESLIHNPNVKIGLKQKHKIAIGIAKGLDYLHSLNPPIIHRDIKPNNILIADDWTPKIIDYGIAREGISSFTNNLTGTVAYMPPESIIGKNLTEKVDVYSYAILLWELYTREIPWKNLNDLQIIEKICKNQRLPLDKYTIPESIKILISWCWDKNYEKRPNFKEILNYFENHVLY